MSSACSGTPCQFVDEIHEGCVQLEFDGISSTTAHPHSHMYGPVDTRTLSQPICRVK